MSPANISNASDTLSTSPAPRLPPPCGRSGSASNAISPILNWAEVFASTDFARAAKPPNRTFWSG